MDMGGMDMPDDIGDTPTANGIPGYFYLQKVFWVIIGSVIAFATLLNILNKALALQRTRSSSAKPRSIFWTNFATATAICREISYASPGYVVVKGRPLSRFPSLGRVVVVLSYLMVICTLCFYKYDVMDQWSWETIAYRCGCIAETQLPLIFLLAGKQNIVGLLTGVGYERLNWIHRWTARILWMTVTFHMGFFFRSWARYDYIKVKLATDDMTQTGFAGWCILTFIFLTSFAPVRRWNYELFVITHIITFAGLIGAIMIHVDDGINYVWTCVAIFSLDRLLRVARILYLNLNIFRRQTSKGFLSNSATLTPLPGDVTRITIDEPISSWKPGQHMFLSCHSVLPFQNHPFTISSLPSDNKMEFLIKAQKGGTKRFHRYALMHSPLPLHQIDKSRRKYIGIEGPYGRIRPLQQFDSVVFFCGSTGATFTMPLMRDIVRRWYDQKRLVTRRVRFVWAIKSRNHIAWFRDQLERVLYDVASKESRTADFEIDLSVYVTCDEKLEPVRLGSSGVIACLPPDSLHGDVAQIASRPTSTHMDEKKDIENGQVFEVNSLKSESDGENEGCGPNGSCCCKSTVVEDNNGKEPVACCCCKPFSSSSSSSSTSPSKPSSVLKILTGRPHPRSIIRRVLEEAEGESAVVVCGPSGLQNDVQDSVVALSDERAVHKGTGAQGIFLHVEGFCY